MRTIKLLRGETAKVCDCHYDTVKNYNWYKTNFGYARANNKGAILLMHRIVNNTPDKLVTDHINMDRLDNRCENLRSATAGQNNTNKRIKASSGHTGVYWDVKAGKWRASVYKNYKTIFVGLFTNKEDAAKAREDARKKLFNGFELGGVR